ncbi:putative autotransporter adhesin-like protein [Arcicella aurantiaca]|uniref:Putative autotransporter adhesin-like protein n=1 Tax=Arcicella aurantiaca TaxID=591202 RepID=A0A316EFH0_9BACT|nr:head GIN domain-containing protein [Arcicella aurantiaca]PWK28851.1 putative autotransporter adhesin-like protein [Arcicella aurantiaca]
MKVLFNFLAIFFLTICFTDTYSQNSEEIRKVSNFKGIQISGGIDLYLRQGSTESVKVVADKDRMDKIITENEGGILKIYVESSKHWFDFEWKKAKEMRVYVTVKDLNALSATGGSDVYTENKLDLIKLELRATGGSDIRLTLDADELTCSTTGGSDVILAGTATVFKASSTGGSDLKASNLKTNFCSVSSTGGSDAYVWAEKEISISATGGSDVYHKGGARVVKSSSTGGSDIHKQ